CASKECFTGFQYLSNDFIGATIVVFLCGARPLIEKADQSLIDSWSPNHFSAFQFSDASHDGISVTAASFDQLCNSVATELAQRSIRGKRACTTRAVWLAFVSVRRHRPLRRQKIRRGVRDEKQHDQKQRSVRCENRNRVFAYCGP